MEKNKYSGKSKQVITFIAKRFVILVNQLFKILRVVEDLIMEEVFHFAKEFLKLNEEDAMKLLIRLVSKNDEEAKKNEENLSESYKKLKN